MIELRRSAALKLLLALMALAIVAAACGGDEGPKVTKGGAIRVELTEPGNLDPPHSDDSEEIIVVRQMFKGLVQYNNETAKVEPASAESWTASADGKTFTFKLRRDNKFSNGEQVKADSFVRGFTRLTSKAEKAELAYHAAGIAGYDAIHEKGTATTLTGVKAVDEFTLEVTLAEAFHDFVNVMGHVAFYPMPSEAAIAGQKPSWAEFPIGNGAFKMKEAQKHNQSVTLVPNENYYDKDKGPYLSEVRFVIVADPDAAYLEWQAGNLDWTRIPPAKITESKAQYPSKFLTKATAGFDYLDTITNKAPTNNKLFRQALSLAIDRKAIGDAIFAGLRIPATGIIPPPMPGYTRPDAQGVGACKFCKLDVAQAKTLLTQSGVKLTSPLRLSLNAGGGHEGWIQAVADNLKKNLGINTTLVSKTPFTEYLTYLNSSAATGIGRLAWGMDYPTPDNFLYPLFHTKSIGLDNYSRYSNPAFDTLVVQARAEKDAAKRLTIYQQAEALVLADMAVIPMWFRVQVRLADFDKFGGLAMDPFEDPTLETTFVKSTG